MSRPRPRQAPSAGDEHGTTQLLTLVCPEAGHRLGTIRGDTARAWIDPARHPGSGQECLLLLSGAEHFAWVCWACASTGPGRCSERLPAAGVWALLARLQAYGPAHLQVPARARELTKAVPALPADLEHIANHRNRLAGAMRAEGEALPGAWRVPRATVGTANPAPRITRGY